MNPLIEALSTLPNDWQLVPVIGKRPIAGMAWNQRGRSPLEMVDWICENYCTGFGLITGTPIDNGSSALLAIDQDGDVAGAILRHLHKREKLPHTVTFTSGRTRRCQRLYKVPREIAAQLHSRKLYSTVPNGGVELRFRNLMSILPPSIHPDTQKPYYWLPQCSPREVAIANAPEWLIQLMLSGGSRQHRVQFISQSPHAQPVTTTAIKERPPLPSIHATFVSESSNNSETERITNLLKQINPARASDYNDWISVGMALYAHSPALLPLWDEWSKQSPKYRPGECTVKWQTFNPNHIGIGKLYYLAQTDSPKSA